MLNKLEIQDRLQNILRCPQSGQKLHFEGNELISENGEYRYPITPTGIPLFVGEYWTKQATLQQEHYDHIAEEYTQNLTYAHTQEYFKVLDDALFDVIKDKHLINVAEICCGRGDAFLLLQDHIEFGVGVDVSQVMLEFGRKSINAEKFQFVQADATHLPIDDAIFDNVFMLGGIHHVNDRQKLFSEVYRILKPGGKFYWREPVSDLFLWRWLRLLVYKLSPTLDFDTERPLRYKETKKVLEESGFILEKWTTKGFLGFILFMNSDVLVFNRLFRHIPGIRRITRWAAKFDDFIIQLPGMKKFGLQVIGYASKPDLR